MSAPTNGTTPASAPAPTAALTPLPAAAPTQTPASNPPGLRDLAPARLWIGVSVAPDFLQDSQYSTLLRREFNTVTPENAMKWEVIHPAPGQYDFREADAIVNFAQAHGLRVRGHTLVWDNQLPDWVKTGNFTRQEWMALLQDHITTVVGRYRGKVAAWDVVNEAFENNGNLRDTIWLRALGPGYIDLAFRWAHAADPHALLFYNDHAAEGIGRKSDAVYTLAQGLLQAGTPIDGIGLQMHIWLGGPLTPAGLAENLGRLGELGLQVQITEMDVRTQYIQATPEEKLAQQAEVYRWVFSACLESPACTGFMTWGLTDKYSWIPSYTKSPDAPLLFDENFRPKPAYDAIIEILGQKH